MKIFTKDERNIVVVLAGLFLVGIGVNYIQDVRKTQQGEEIAIEISDQVRSHYSKDIKDNSTENYLININEANTEDLVYLNGIGPKTAEKIIRLRNELGGFTEVEDLLQVPGIGEKTFEKFRSQITI